MPGFGFDDNELAQLFAEAGAAVKKAHSEPSTAPAAAPPAPVPETQAIPEEAPPVEEAQYFAPKPAASPSSAPEGPMQQVIGGSLDQAGLTLTHAEGGRSQVAWSSVSSLALGRLPDGLCLAFQSGTILFYFMDSRVDYRGLLPELQPTTIMNWRSLVGALASSTGRTGDSGIQAMTSGGGMVPRYGSINDLARQTGGS